MPEGIDYNNAAGDASASQPASSQPSERVRQGMRDLTVEQFAMSGGSLIDTGSDDDVDHTDGREQKANRSINARMRALAQASKQPSPPVIRRPNPTQNAAPRLHGAPVPPVGAMPPATSRPLPQPPSPQRGAIVPPVGRPAGAAPPLARPSPMSGGAPPTGGRAPSYPAPQRPGFAADDRYATSLQGNYRNEKADVTKHRMGDVLQAVFDRVYLPMYPGKTLDSDYFAWLDTLSEASMYEVLFQARYEKLRDAMQRSLEELKDFAREGDEFAKRNVKHFMKGVEYLVDADARRDYKVKYDKATRKLMLGPNLLDTKTMKTVFSGNGWGIWIMSPRMGRKQLNKFYTNSHILGEFHHSSFLAGEDIISGGEWKVTDGEIVTINSKTGHYQTGLLALTETLEVLRSRGVPLGKANVMTWSNNKPKTTPVLDFLANKDDVMSNSPAGPSPKPPALPPRKVVMAKRPGQN